jgi:hypothetical protein
MREWIKRDIEMYRRIKGRYPAPRAVDPDLRSGALFTLDLGSGMGKKSRS